MWAPVGNKKEQGSLKNQRQHGGNMDHLKLHLLRKRVGFQSYFSLQPGKNYQHEKLGCFAILGT